MFERADLISRDDYEPGIALRDVARAIMIWAAMNSRPITVSECAMTFNTSVDLVREAVHDGYWTFLSPDDESDPTKQFIEVDGA